MVKGVVKEDLELETPFDVLAYGVKLFTYTDEEKTQEAERIKEKVQDRIQDYYEKKMRPIFK